MKSSSKKDEKRHGLTQLDGQMRDAMTAINIEKYRAMACVVAGIIRELKQVPAGHLYARLVAYMTISEFEIIIKTLIDSKLIIQKDCMISFIEKY